MFLYGLKLPCACLERNDHDLKHLLKGLLLNTLRGSHGHRRIDWRVQHQNVQGGNFAVLAQEQGTSWGLFQISRRAPLLV